MTEFEPPVGSVRLGRMIEVGSLAELQALVPFPVVAPVEWPGECGSPIYEWTGATPAVRYAIHSSAPSSQGTKYLSVVGMPKDDVGSAVVGYGTITRVIGETLVIVAGRGVEHHVLRTVASSLRPLQSP